LYKNQSELWNESRIVRRLVGYKNIALLYLSLSASAATTAAASLLGSALTLILALTLRSALSLALRSALVVLRQLRRASALLLTLALALTLSLRLTLTLTLRLTLPSALSLGLGSRVDAESRHALQSHFTNGLLLQRWDRGETDRAGILGRLLHQLFLAEVELLAVGVVEAQPGLPSHLGAVLVTVLTEGATLVFLGRQVAYHSLRALNLQKDKNATVKLASSFGFV